MGYLFGEYEIKENMVNYHKVINACDLRHVAAGSGQRQC